MIGMKVGLSWPFAASDTYLRDGNEGGSLFA